MALTKKKTLLLLSALSLFSGFLIYFLIKPKASNAESEKSCCSHKARRFDSPAGMVLIPSGTFMMGASTDDSLAKGDEFPRHKVIIDEFYMDEHEVTNKEFAQFIKATNYVTTAEKKPDWEELKKQVPPGTKKPDESLLVPASLVFVSPNKKVDRNNLGNWWKWVKGANYKHPLGPDSSIKDKNDHPVVHVSWFDAKAYCEWAGKQLPTEAQFEWALRGGLIDNPLSWGHELPESGQLRANIWDGDFPYSNNQRDGYLSTAPVKSFAPNKYGLYDIAGNVWEWVNDFYNNQYYAKIASTEGIRNPPGPKNSLDPTEPTVEKRVMRGGSFLCNKSYCTGYRVSARMRNTPDTSTSHTGFRCVKNL